MREKMSDKKEIKTLWNSDCISIIFTQLQKDFSLKNNVFLSN